MMIDGKAPSKRTCTVQSSVIQCTYKFAEQIDRGGLELIVKLE